MSEVNNDIDGKKSHKRVWSGYLLGSGLGMAWLWFVIYCIKLFQDKVLSMEFPFEMWIGLIGAGMTGIGLVLGERHKALRS